MQELDLENDERVKIIAFSFGVSIQEVINCIERFSEIAERVTIAFSEICTHGYEYLKELAEYVKEIEFENEYKKEIYRLDFKRPKIQHQVLDRKPRNLIKKII